MRAAVEIDAWSDALGGLVERHPGFWTALGRLESRLLRERIDRVPIDRPIYVAGLARSGSTVLLELLASHPDTASHRYRDFPMVLSPCAWSWFVDRAGRNAHEPRERAHHDRIAVTPESPEAFEEMIWMAFFRNLHAPGAPAVFDAAASHPDFEAFYRDHVRKLLLLRGAGRYLAKGNYNVTRLAYLKKLFPDARFLVPVRDPVWHIASLMKQHVLFADAGARDRRVRHHLRRAGHFEFGLDRRATDTGDGRADEALRLWRDGEEAAGWAMQWSAVYGHVAEALDDPGLAASVGLVRHEDLCADPATTMRAVLDHCGLDDEGQVERACATISPPDYYAPSFTAAELEAIRHRTAGVAARFGYG